MHRRVYRDSRSKDTTNDCHMTFAVVFFTLQREKEHQSGNAKSEEFSQRVHKWIECSLYNSRMTADDMTAGDPMVCIRLLEGNYEISTVFLRAICDGCSWNGHLLS